MNGNDSYDEFSLGNNYEPNISIIIPSSNNNVVNTSFDFELILILFHNNNIYKYYY